MAKRIFKGNIDLDNNELQVAKLEQLSTAPGTPQQSRFFYDTTLKHPRIYDGLDWINLVRGSNQVNASATARTTTTSSTYQTKTSFATGIVNTSYTYRIDFSAVLDSTTANRNINFRIFNSTDAVVLYEAKDIRVPNANSQIPASGFVIVTFGSTATRTIQMQWNSDNNSSTIGIAYAYLDFYRIK